MKILSFSSFGYEGEIITVEADLRKGLPVTDIVGLPGSAVKEARERVKAAVRNSNLTFPSKRILINLSPADKKKEGSSFDLPIALAVLTGEEKEVEESNDINEIPVMIMGELELSGKIRAVRGVFGAISQSVNMGIKYFIVPKENEAETGVEGAIVFTANNLIEALTYLYKIKEESNLTNLKPYKHNKKITHDIFTWSNVDEYIDDIPLNGFEEVKGQPHLIRALEIAAAGGHNLIAYGPPGCGKTLSLRRFPLLLPDMDDSTSMEVTRIYSIAGLLPSNHEKNILLKRPPFRMPHPNASVEGIIGGAGKCMPGEVSLAHGGVLFLDEAALFKGTVLQSLRNPLEAGCVTLSRAGRSTTFPSRFQLLLAVNPCPCGNLGAIGKVCTCMPNEIEKYWKKLTAPLLDRIDIRIAVLPPKSETLLKEKPVSTAKLQANIKNAKIFQFDRMARLYPNEKNKAFLTPNAALSGIDSIRVCKMDDEAKKLFPILVESQKLSGRGSFAILKISRTIADLEQKNNITVAHIEEAFELRKWIKYLPDFL